MAFSISPRGIAAPRYTVTLKMVEGGNYAAPAVEGTVYQKFCETFADVKARLRHHAGWLQRSEVTRFYWVHDPSRWFAAAVQTARSRRQPFLVAKATDGKVSTWLTVVAL